MGEKRSDLGDPAFITVERVEDIPIFASEDEEHAFWKTHHLSDALPDDVRRQAWYWRLAEQVKRELSPFVR